MRKMLGLAWIEYEWEVDGAEGVDGQTHRGGGRRKS